MTVFLIIISLYGGIKLVPMNSEAACKTAAEMFNSPAHRVAQAFCIKNTP